MNFSYIIKRKSEITTFAFFTLFKSLTYFAPLLLAFYLGEVNQNKYGAFEYTINIGQVLMVIFTFGISSAYPYFILRENKTSYIPIFHFHFVISFFILLITSVFFLKETNIIYIGIITGVFLSDQLFITNILRTNNRTLLSIVIDTSLYIILSIYCILLLLKILHFSFQTWSYLLLITQLMTTILFHFPHIKNIKQLTFSDFKSVYSYSFLIVFVGPLLFLTTNSTRLIIEYQLTLEDVGLYSMFFRVSSIVLIFNRVFTILMFKNLYQDEVSKLDMKIFKINVIVLLIILLTFLFFSFVLPFFEKYNNFSFSDNKTLLFFSLIQIYFWINTAYLEPIFQREQLLKPFLIILILNLFSLYFSIYILNILIDLNVNAVTFLNSLFIFFLLLFQHKILLNKGLNFKKVKFITILTGIVFISISIILLI